MKSKNLSSIICQKKRRITFFKKHKQSYKVEIINDLDVDEVSIYENGPFIDLCKGPHVDTHKRNKSDKAIKGVRGILAWNRKK